jgi:FdhD protein
VTGRTARRRVLRITLPSGDTQGGDAPQACGRVGINPQADLLAAEEPLEIRVGGEPLTVTMRTPGDDTDLAAGFLVSEGIVRSAADIIQIRICGNGRGSYRDHETAHNVADVSLSPGRAAGPVLRRSFPTSSACGVCGKTTISELVVRSSYDLSADKTVVAPATLARMPSLLRDAQQVFSKTGGLHAAGLFASSGEMLALREDVGRHNAVDKVVGWALREGLLPLTGRVLLVSGRASFELTQKCLLAGIPVLAAVSAPSSLAAELAHESGMTLVGFLRGGSMNVYSGEARLPA